jgi:rhodanese-related sulfurtransferase
VTSGKVATTLGYERRNNPALRFDDREAFVAFMTGDQPARPANMANIVAINQGRRPLTMEAPVPQALAPLTVASLLAGGHVVVDTRRGSQFAAGHVPGAINVQLASPEFEQRVGWTAPADAGLILVLDQDAEAAAAMRALAFVGLDSRVSGYLAGGMRTWAAAGLDVATLDEIDVLALRDRLTGDAPVRVLDVRERAEWDAGHVPGSDQVSYKSIARDPRAAMRREGEFVAVVCQSGGRSSTAASLLLRAGARRVVNVTGGTQAWIAAGLPVERGRGVRTMTWSA